MARTVVLPCGLRMRVGRLTTEEDNELSNRVNSGVVAFTHRVSSPVRPMRQSLVVRRQPSTHPVGR